MTNPIIKIVNSKTGKEIQREMNEAELSEYNFEISEAKALAQETKAREAARQSALSKLAALGLTEDEIKAIAG